MKNGNDFGRGDRQYIFTTHDEIDRADFYVRINSKIITPILSLHGTFQDCRNCQRSDFNYPRSRLSTHRSTHRFSGRDVASTDGRDDFMGILGLGFSNEKLCSYRHGCIRRLLRC